MHTQPTNERQAQLALGNIGMPILISILRDERSDTALVRGAIECLHVSMAQAPKARQQEAQATPAHAMNAQLFTTNRENMSLLLSLFDDEDGMAPNGGQPGGASVVQRDFYIRYHAVKTLAALMHATPFRVQEVLLGGGGVKVGVRSSMCCYAHYRRTRTHVCTTNK